MAQSAAPVLLPPPTRRAGTGVCPQLLLDGADAHVPVEPDLKHARLQVRVRHISHAAAPAPFGRTPPVSRGRGARSRDGGCGGVVLTVDSARACPPDSHPT